MYADRVEAGSKASIRERLNGDNDPSRRRQIAGKRQRQGDDKWEHDLYSNDGSQVSNRRVGLSDLRLKLKKKSVTQSGNRSLPGGAMRDLREKLSGTIYTQPANSAPTKPKATVEANRSVRKMGTVDALAPETKRVGSLVSKAKPQQKVETVDSFLQSLGLEKYSITLQAEEVDMTALLHMTDEDLKALGIPMGPRKKIQLALEAKV